ncbi:protein of unknown function [Azospirillum baldaniorum]|uniref:Uncharacterized protein n=1 Tax=Azospirillum baldaniorum TaxID=1064539 RepID=A0A9P1NMP9_9PROT|nr:protein of unknown function [Azospirillum baldaniorum]
MRSGGAGERRRQPSPPTGTPAPMLPDRRCLWRELYPMRPIRI